MPQPVQVVEEAKQNYTPNKFKNGTKRKAEESEPETETDTEKVTATDDKIEQANKPKRAKRSRFPLPGEKGFKQASEWQIN